MTTLHRSACAVFVGLTSVCIIHPAAASESELHLENGWFVQDGHVIWGYAQHNGWWRPGQRANITRNAPGEIRPNRTEHLGKLAENMKRYGYPGFEHNFGLWYDRRRDAHDTGRRPDANAVSPFLEQPWGRSGEGRAWDGLSKYDLEKFNPWYFDRLKEFAGRCEANKVILFHNFYMQHALLETDAHYVDFPWRPANCIQDTGMPDRNPAANIFYDLTHEGLRNLHRAYIRKCLDVLGFEKNVVFLASEEYTGPLGFMRFWLDEVADWQTQNNTRVLVVLGATKDVLDALANDARVAVLDLRYWWYKPDGTVYAPTGGQETPGRYASGGNASQTTPEQIYRQVKEYRMRYPQKGLIHTIEASRQQTWAFLMGGGSMLLRYMEYPGSSDPEDYIAPEHSSVIQPIYDFVNRNLGTILQKMKPADLVLNDTARTWCLSAPNQAYLVYALKGGRIDLDLAGVSGEFEAKWLNPRNGAITDANGGSIAARGAVSFQAPSHDDWALWLHKTATTTEHEDHAKE